MARLQKKKTIVDKGKKKGQDDVALASADSAGSEVKAKSAVPGFKQPVKTPGKSIKSASSASSTLSEPNVIQKGLQFFKEVRVELKKVTWPNRKQTAGSTVVVIILVFIIASFLGLVDFGLSKLVQVVLA